MEGKGCSWIIAIFIAVICIANCNDKKTESNTTSSNYSNHSYTSNNSSYSQPKLKEKTAEERLLEQFRGNSLSNGAQPYSSAYGTNSTYGNSEIVVRASSSQDVVVIIKRNNSNGPVSRHAYIAKGCSYTFHVPAGTYQPFFYSGDSWCPSKAMAGGVRGGFLRYESFSKDYPQALEDYTQLTYSLTATVNGNFNTKSSSESEVF